jgi:hypothetical protein
MACSVTALAFKLRKVCYSLPELFVSSFEFIWVDRGVKTMKHIEGGASYTRLGTSKLD